jgi:hypothetical protein
LYRKDRPSPKRAADFNLFLSVDDNLNVSVNSRNREILGSLSSELENIKFVVLIIRANGREIMRENV